MVIYYILLIKYCGIPSGILVLDKNVLRERERKRENHWTRRSINPGTLCIITFLHCELPECCLVKILHLKICLLISKGSDESATD